MVSLTVQVKESLFREMDYLGEVGFVEQKEVEEIWRHLGGSYSYRHWLEVGSEDCPKDVLELED